MSAIEVGNVTKPIRQLGGTLPNEQQSHLRPAPPKWTRALERPPKRPWRWTTASTTYNDIKTEPDRQVPKETVCVSDDSSEQYKDSCESDQNGSDTEQDGEDNDIPDATAAGVRYRSRTADKQTNNGVSSGRVSTTAGSHETVVVGRTPAARACITPG